MQNNNKSFILKGLDCASCAAKIEEGVKRIEGVTYANCDFVNSKLSVEIDDSYELEKTIKELKKLVKNIEPNVEIIEYENEKIKDDNELLRRGIRYGISAILFTVALIFNLSVYVKFTLFFISYIIVGGEVILTAGKKILKGQVFDEHFLMSIATIGAFVIGEYPESVAVMLFYQIGELLQDIAVDRSKRSIKELMNIRPDYANLKIGYEIKRVSPQEVRPGDVIIVKPGEKIPLDGKVIEGESMVDTSALTGESVLKEVYKGADVLSGFINKNGLLTIEVTREFAESTVSKILGLIEEASSKKAPTEKFMTKFAKYYTPIVVFLALIIAVIPPLIIPAATFKEFIYRALIFLVISCPCALVLSIPLTFFAGIGAASKNGILVKGSNYLEALSNVETVVFDKTGTLTKGVFKVTKIKSVNGMSRDALLEYAAYAESFSNHPIAESILKAYGKEVDRSKIKKYEEISGNGVRANIEGKEVLVGNAKLMKMGNIDCVTGDSTGTIIHVAIDNKYCGYILISDEVKEDSPKAIESLRKMGIKRIVMLTGDNKAISDKIAASLRIDEVYSELFPNEKVGILEKLYANNKKGKLIFVGDGINDAPVLARADVGVAMGGIGSDVAIEAADVVLMTDEPSKLVTAIKISKKTKLIVWENILLALGVKIVVLALGALGVPTMWEAVFADVGVALLAVLNALRVLTGAV
ncbi:MULTISPECIES: heavy metal translocating P-type ATPase [Thermoanaerobacter]|uniref:Heavy metal translocating P-type ATPase n=2 Tax=Thermoanaerobacter TaxID=1754 RepID=B0KC11_THEP3|nr:MULTISPECIES: heavy metal translocating P-type ATPase [Thermoanaerobacter]ABY93947.1 heavy metal translocating P-type ATPase [Thermoanaerobacter pseudethanolicus ATCC 33223]ADV78905.1 heavy metal translocating P-type ATPase [Thermoanaerobacter brockii subsp. finnii Ako-1]HBW60135.1 cadmium-translocating P-type ATPase [Thermoanaerobacter sp.]